MNDEVTTKPKQNNTKWIIFIVLALLLGGLLGYTYGKNSTEADLQAQYDQKTLQLQKELSQAKTSASGTVEEGQDSVDALQAENASLKTTVDTQTKKIADLEKQLADAKKSSTTTTPPATPPTAQ